MENSVEELEETQAVNTYQRLHDLHYPHDPKLPDDLKEGQRWWTIDVKDVHAPVKSFTYVGPALDSDTTHVLVETMSKKAVSWNARKFAQARRSALEAYEYGAEYLRALLAHTEGEAQRIREGKFCPEGRWDEQPKPQQ